MAWRSFGSFACVSVGMWGTIESWSERVGHAQKLPSLQYELNHIYSVHNSQDMHLENQQECHNVVNQSHMSHIVVSSKSHHFNQSISVPRDHVLH